MSKNIKTLRQYASMRKKFPSVMLLGNIKKSLQDDLLKLSKTTPVSNNRSIDLRSGVYGVEYDNTSPAGKTYNQKHIDEFIIGIEVLNTFTNKTEWRFAELDGYSDIPMHLDDPYSYRFLIVLEGSHEFETETETVTMLPGDVYFINGAYRHAVHNINPERRIALLGKMEINEHNTEILRARA